MGITVKLYGRLKQYLPENSSAREITWPFQEGMTVPELIKAIEIPSEENIMVILVNSEDILELDDGINDELQNGDIVELFPPMMGG